MSMKPSSPANDVQSLSLFTDTEFSKNDRQKRLSKYSCNFRKLHSNKLINESLIFAIVEMNPLAEG